MLKIKRRKMDRRTKEFTIIVVALVLIVGTFLYTRQRTQILHAEQYIDKVKAQCYIFKESEYISLGKGEKINFSVKEGQKVGANTSLSKSYKIKTNKYLNDAIDVIDWILKHGSYGDRNTFVKELLSVDEQVNKMQQKAERMKDDEVSEEKIKVNKRLNSLKKKQRLMQKSLKYIFADNDTLQRVKDELKSKKSVKNKTLTVSNLNFSYTGNVFFSTTGYEEVLDSNLMGILNEDYFKFLDEFKPEPSDIEEDGQIIKIVHNKEIYICPILDKDIILETEEECKEYKLWITKNFDLEELGGYYDLIERRVDILRSFPSITVEDKNGNTRNGFLVDVLSFQDKKVPVICVKDEIASFMNVANDNYNIYVEQVESYILPSSSIIRKNNKDYVFVLNTGDFQELVEVKIYKKEGSKVYLRPFENENLAENMEVITNPGG